MERFLQPNNVGIFSKEACELISKVVVDIRTAEGCLKKYTNGQSNNVIL